jgi:SOS-response transcriptional repressor LexA
MTSNRPIKFVASGFPSPADDFAEHNLDLNKFLIKHPAATFYMKNKSHANKRYGIFPGDIVVVDRSLMPIPNRLNLVIEENEFRILDYKSLKRANQEIEFWGVITAIIRKF